MLSFDRFTTRYFLVILIIFIYIIINSFLFFVKFIILATFLDSSILAMC
jgi:hypothetical protein